MKYILTFQSVPNTVQSALATVLGPTQTTHTHIHIYLYIYVWRLNILK